MIVTQVHGLMYQHSSVFGMDPVLEISKKHCLIHIVFAMSAIILVRAALQHYQLIVSIVIRLILELRHLIHVLAILAMLMSEFPCVRLANFI